MILPVTLTVDGMHSDTSGSDSDLLQNTTDSSIVPESTHTSSGTDISYVLPLSLGGKSGTKLITFLAIYIFYDRVCFFL